MYLPEWILEFKEPRTEIRLINNTYYKYEVKYIYNKEKKRTDKITVRLLGKIEEGIGFIPSDKNSIREAKTSPKVDIKTFGLYHLFSNLLENEFTTFKALFNEDVSERIFSFAMMRWAYQSPIKRASRYHVHDFCSEYWSKNSISDKLISNALQFVGENRENLVVWMKGLLETSEINTNKFVMMDSTHVTSLSEQLAINAVGYNPERNYDTQIRLMYLFSSELQKPVYYRLINGNITDIKSMALCVQEMNIQDVIYIADKGFFSLENIQQLEKHNLQYIIPLHRNNKLIDFAPLLKANFKKELKTYFLYQERVIWYYEYQQAEMKIITFLDEKLKIKEENDYILRIKSMPEEYTETKFYEKLHQFGTLTMTYKTKEMLNASQLYQAYKQRNEVEIMFDGYKNFLKADRMYMQDRHVLEGWLAANFIAMIAYYKLYTRLKDAKLLSKTSPKDIIELSKSIYKIKINDEWRLSEITVKTKALFKKLNIDYLNICGVRG
jgi:hypothetical protein